MREEHENCGKKTSCYNSYVETFVKLLDPFFRGEKYERVGKLLEEYVNLWKNMKNLVVIRHVITPLVLKTIYAITKGQFADHHKVQ